MTKQNDRDDVQAREAGFEVHDHPKGRAHAHSRYVKGDLHVWRINGFRTGMHWQTAMLVNGRYREHQPKPTLADALERGVSNGR